MDENKLILMAELILKKGVNLKEGQDLYINCPIDCAYVARVFAKQAYALSARLVKVNYSDEKFTRITYENASIDALTEVPQWFIDSKNHMLDTNACYISIAADDPNAYKGVDAEKISASQVARAKALKKFSDAVMNNEIRWCVVSVPTKEWAETVFPQAENPMEELWNAIFSTIRLDEPNPIKANEEHFLTLKKRAETLNAYNFDRLIFKNSIGTDLSVGLADDHVWLAAEEVAKDGTPFIANLPSEEIFTAPNKDKVFGTLKSALPLCVDGNIIDEFSITFDNGRIVDFNAKKGYDTLKRLIETDEGTRYLGEVALIGKNSPIAKMKTLFYNTLFDENASCHLAIGKAYPTTIKNGGNLSKEELLKKGANDSAEHCDFMIGTDDLSVIGVTKDGKEITLFIDGDFVL